MKKAISILGSIFVLFSFSAFVSSTAGEDLSQVRIKPFPVAMQCWTYRRYSFFEAAGKSKELGISYLQAYPGQPLSPGDKDALFDHNMRDVQIEQVRKRLSEMGMSVVSYGVVDTGRTEESMRQVFDFARKMGIRTIVAEPQDDDFPILDKLVEEYNINIAIHNHPEPSKYAKPEVALEYIRDRNERIGVCADTGHWMRGGLRPVDCLRYLSGRIVDVHLKDRSDFGTGKTAEDVPFGQGKADVRAILAELTVQNYGGFLTIEYENEREVLTPEPATRKGLEFIKSVTYFDDYEELLRRRAGARYAKHGWNHYGPGYFELDEKDGILKSQGGMGLLWYSAKKYRDFVLELDYRCSQENTNSGIFVRVPEMPSSDDYIYHSFEIQIDDAGKGIHSTGAVYDAEAPTKNAAKPAGEWNHFKIIFQGRHIEVELNGVQILSWDAEPRGKVRDFAAAGYIGLQNHDSIAPVYFRDIFIKEM
jgi:sugar phosphate isomerase/epimerase